MNGHKSSDERPPGQGSAPDPAGPARTDGPPAADHRNPFTRLLERRLGAQRHAPAGAAEFVERWDRLEALVIAIYRRGAALDEEREAFDALAAWFGRHYPEVSERLAPHWRGRSGAPDGEPSGPSGPGDPAHPAAPPAADPFRRLFEGRRADSFAGDREALRTLPTAREAVNRWVLERADQE